MMKKLSPDLFFPSDRYFDALEIGQKRKKKLYSEQKRTKISLSPNTSIFIRDLYYACLVERSSSAL